MHRERGLSRAAESEEQGALVLELFRARVEGANHLSARVNAEASAGALFEPHLLEVHRHAEVPLLDLAEIIRAEHEGHAVHRVDEDDARREVELLRHVPPLGHHDENLAGILFFLGRRKIEYELVPHDEEPRKLSRHDRAAVVGVRRMEPHLLVHDEELDAGGHEVVGRRLQNLLLPLVGISEEHLGERGGTVRDPRYERRILVLRENVRRAARSERRGILEREVVDDLAVPHEPVAVAAGRRDLRGEVFREGRRIGAH